tara:strand:+ start:358 stop:1374 length:1017 start_codon:yes stop_codon:yes gene_type:complete
MKLNDFNKKPTSLNRSLSNKIVINNTASEARYKAEIEELNTQLGHYRRIEAERDKAVSKFNSIEETLKTERFEADKNRELIVELEKEKINLSGMNEQIPALDEDLRTAKGLAAVANSELDIMTKRAVEQSKELSLLKSNLDSINNNYNNLSIEAKEAISRKQSTDADFEAISNKNKKLQSFTDETSKINNRLIEENKTLRDWANYKDVENKELLVQLEELKTIEAKLREWMGNMEIKDSQNSSSKNSLETKVSTQQKVITDMSKTLDDMMKEMAYIAKLNREYKKELIKPTYSSMSAIASQEGFVMPNGKENIRTHNLGNYKPTMLKFKKKEETKNGR